MNPTIVCMIVFTCTFAGAVCQELAGTQAQTLAPLQPRVFSLL
jgi:hypothetical protein